MKTKCLILFALVMQASCDKPESTPATQKAQPPLSSGAVVHNAAPGSVRQTIARQGIANELRQLATYYRLYNNDFNRSPGKLDDLKAYIERDAPTLYDALKEDYYIVIWNVSNLSSNVVLAYEKDADKDGMRFVAMGDGSVKKTNEQDLQAALRER